METPGRSVGGAARRVAPSSAGSSPAVPTYQGWSKERLRALISDLDREWTACHWHLCVDHARVQYLDVRRRAARLET